MFEAVSYTARMVLLVVEHVAAFAERCILTVCVAPPSNTGGIFGRRVGTWDEVFVTIQGRRLRFPFRKGWRRRPALKPEIEVLQACRTA